MQLNACICLCFVYVFAPIVFVSVILLFPSFLFYSDSPTISCNYCEPVNFKSAYSVVVSHDKIIVCQH